MWAADGMFLTLAVPSGTVGNTIDLAYTPSSYNLLLNSWASAASPIMHGVIGVSLCPISNPNSFKPFLR